MIWQAVVWVIWRIRNDAIFANKCHDKRRSRRLNRSLGNDCWQRNLVPPVFIL
jgi:hypothetical protein